jgi:integrase
VTFAVHSLQRLTENAIDVNAYLYYLQTYMGHASLRETQDYLWLTGESFRPILERMENCAPFIQTIFEEKERDPDYE